MGRCQLGGYPFLFVVMEYAEQTLAQILPHWALRWGHGYAYEPDSLFDPLVDRDIGASRAQLGRIHFAGTDAAWMAYADRAIDTAHRVAGEIAG
jgi:hypothetical protein